MGDIAQYAKYFTSGLKVTVCVPLDNNDMFRDWAATVSLEKDMITLQMSRDLYPATAHLVNGIMLDLRIGVGDAGYRCGGILVEASYNGIIRVLLTGDIAAAEPREYYRIDIFLPFRYEFSKEQNLDVLIGKWRKRKQVALASATVRRKAFVDRQQIRRSTMQEVDASDLLQHTNTKQNVEVYSDVDETWDHVNAYAMNLSAGGFRFVTSDNFHLDELVFIEMFIPLNPPRIVDTVARVVSKTDHHGIMEEKQYFNIAVHFVLIHDRDRDAIVSHIFQMEALRIRQKGYLPFYDSQPVNRRITPIKMALCMFLLLALFLSVSYYYEYSIRDIRNEIQEIFGEAVKQYRYKGSIQSPPP